MIALHFRLSLDSGFNANFLHVVVNALEDFMMNGIRFFPIWLNMRKEHNYHSFLLVLMTN